MLGASGAGAALAFRPRSRTDTGLVGRVSSVAGEWTVREWGVGWSWWTWGGPPGASKVTVRTFVFILRTR